MFSFYFTLEVIDTLIVPIFATIQHSQISSAEIKHASGADVGYVISVGSTDIFSY